jgi:hypothetical protein
MVAGANTLRYVKVRADRTGASEFADAVIEVELRHVVDGVPPVAVAGPYDAIGITFVV